MSKRVDYAAAAPVYDRPWYRKKTPDPLLRDFLSKRGVDGRARILDVGCGTGAQLAANRCQWPNLFYVGADTSTEMLRVANARNREILWLNTNGSAMPFPVGSFDYVSNQYALHHIDGKLDFLAEIARVLRVGGRVAITNHDPWSMKRWALYNYFPGALEHDLDDYCGLKNLRWPWIQRDFRTFG